jgi:hypothetical protein
VEDVDAAVRGDAGAHHALDVGRLGHIGHVRLAAVALPADDPDGLLDRLALEIDRNHVGPLAREEHCRGLAVAPARAGGAGAGDDRDLPLQSSRHQSASGTIA